MYCACCVNIHVYKPLLLSTWPGVLFLVRFNNFWLDCELLLELQTLTLSHSFLCAPDLAKRPHSVLLHWWMFMDCSPLLLRWKSSKNPLHCQIVDCRLPGGFSLGGGCWWKRGWGGGTTWPLSPSPTAFTETEEEEGGGGGGSWAFCRSRARGAIAATAGRMNRGLI